MRVLTLVTLFFIPPCEDCDPQHAEDCESVESRCIYDRICSGILFAGLLMFPHHGGGV
jgi:hypothetical protein